MNITAKELSGQHIGKQFEVIVPGYDGTPVTGNIYRINHYPGWTKIILGPTRSVSLDHDTPITIQEGQ